MENECDLLKSKLFLCEWNPFYFIEIAFIGFTLHEIKQCIVFFGTPGIFIPKFYFTYNFISVYPLNLFKVMILYV